MMCEKMNNGDGEPKQSVRKREVFAW